MVPPSERPGGFWALPAFLRSWGIEVSAEDFAVGLRVLAQAADGNGALPDPARAGFLLRPVFARDLRSWDRFPALFEAFLRGEEAAMGDSGEGDAPPDLRGRSGRAQDPGTPSGSERAEAAGDPEGDGARPGAQEPEDSGAGTDPGTDAERASPQGTGQRPGRPAARSARLAELLRRYHELTKPPPGRRFAGATRGPRVHLGRTLALARTTGGEPIRLAREAPRPPRPHRVLLVDTSTSMEAQEGFLERLAQGMQALPVRAEVYGFSVRLFAWRRRGEGGAIWAGGTRIGESLLQYLHGPGRHLTRRSYVMVVSDGWETGDLAFLVRALGGLTRRAGRVDWLCPIAGSDGFEPTCRGLRAALGVGVAVYDVHDTASFERYLAAAFRPGHGASESVDRGWQPSRRRRGAWPSV